MSNHRHFSFFKFFHTIHDHFFKMGQHFICRYLIVAPFSDLIVHYSFCFAVCFIFYFYYSFCEKWLCEFTQTYHLKVFCLYASDRPVLLSLYLPIFVQFCQTVDMPYISIPYNLPKSIKIFFQRSVHSYE
jgi:hypothetical protein